MELGHQVRSIDNNWFGSYLKPHKNLETINSDIRDLKLIHFENIETIIHLANIANDPLVELNPKLSWEVNVLASQQLADLASKASVENFIFASSGSVYGVSQRRVTEDTELIPISEYNKTKMVAERVFLSYRDKMKIFCIRPATVCGVSPRMRLDVSVNILTYSALKNGLITVFGGDQVRPNIHIDDICAAYIFFINNLRIFPLVVLMLGLRNFHIRYCKSVKEHLPETKLKLHLQMIRDLTDNAQISF